MQIGVHTYDEDMGVGVLGSDGRAVPTTETKLVLTLRNSESRPFTNHCNGVRRALKDTVIKIIWFSFRDPTYFLDK